MRHGWEWATLLLSVAPLACDFPDYGFADTSGGGTGGVGQATTAGHGGSAGGAGAAGAECASDADCAGSPGGPACDLDRGQCVPCTLTDDPCPPGTICNPSSETCVPGCTPEHACPSGVSCCAGVCVDTQTDAQNCGVCGSPCAPPGGIGVCAGGFCQLAACLGGFADCDTIAANGCEVHTQDDLSNCGACGQSCALPNAAPACVSGACAVDHCAVPFGDCNAIASDGCETNLNTDVASCGACGTACSLANAVAACSNGACVVQSCTGTFADCDGVAANGCEADLQTSPIHCGACGAACSANNGAPSCSGGACGIACDPGFADCDTIAANGCEINTATNVANCGACESPCPAQGGQPACEGGACTVSSCLPGKGNCDGNSMNGCEADLTTDAQSCGGCGIACFAANGAAACGGSACFIASCDPGFADCNGLYADGCETSTASDGDHCGTCAASCAASQSCAMSSCAACAPGKRDCDRAGANGCESTVAIDPNNCGACGNVCAGAPHAASACVSAACGIACDPDFANCDASSANGCECAGNLCCNGACEPPHVNGLGQPFDDCAPLGVPGNEATYTHALAVNARAAWPIAGQDSDCSCIPNAQCVSRKTATSCATWMYTKSAAGHVNLNIASNTCVCPTIADPVWK